MSAQPTSHLAASVLPSRERERVGNYLLGSEIGRGSFATVQRGYKADTRDIVAIKIVQRAKMTSKLLENLEAEIAILKAIDHPNIVGLEDCLKLDERIYLIMDYCSGGDLSFYIKKRGRLPTLDYVPESGGKEQYWPHPEEGGLDETVVRCFLGQLALALKFLRSQNLIHRDIKPQNLLLQPPSASQIASGHPLGIPILKVADFGFARFLEGASMAETLCGSPLYMAPEILRYEKYDAKADLWSVGTVLYEMCAGKPPFKAQNHVELLKKIERGEDKIRFPDDKSSWNPEAAAANAGGNGVRAKPVSREIKDLVRRLLKRNPIQRMSFEEFFRDEVVEGETSRVKEPKVIKIPNPPPSMQATANTPPSARPPPTAAPIPIRSAPLPPPFAFPLPASPAPASFVAPITSYGQSPPSRTSSVSTTRPHAQPFSEPSSPPTTQPRPIPMSSARPPFAQQSSSPTYQTTSRMSPRRTPSSFEPSVGLRESDRRMSVGAGRRPGLGGRRDSSDSVGPAASSGVGFGDEDDDNYVVVEKRTVEINSLADELDAAFQRPIGTVARRRSSRSLLSRPLSAFTSGSSPPTSTGLSSSPHSNSFALSVTPPFALASSPSRPSPLQHNYSSSLTRPLAVPRAPSHLDSSPAPYSAGSAGSGHSFLPSSSSSHQQPHLHRYSSSPTTGGVLARAISIASGRIFGTSPSSAAAKGAGVVARATARRKALVGAGDADPAEIQLLNLLSDLAQKAHAIVEFADWKLAMLVSAAEGSALGTSNANSPGSSSGFQGGAGIGYHPSGGGTGMNRRKSSGAGSNSGSDASMFKLDVVAAESLILYLKALAFLQKGMEAAKVFWQEVMVGKVGAGGAEGGGIEASADLNESVQWFRARFNETFEKADWAKTRCAEEVPESATFAERLLYDRAMEISRTAAIHEALGDEPGPLEQQYESAIWMFRAILDDTIREGGLMEDEDRATVDKFIVAGEKRLEALRRRMASASSSTGTAAVAPTSSPSPTSSSPHPPA